MKEVLTKSFWQDVKKTFDDAVDGVAPEPPKPAESVPETQPATPLSSEAEPQPVSAVEKDVPPGDVDPDLLTAR